MTVDRPAHILVVPFGAWGHCRPLLNLCTQLLIAHPSLHITILPYPSVLPRVQSELASCLAYPSLTSNSASVPVPERIQLINVVPEDFASKDEEGKTELFGVDNEFDQCGLALPGYLKALLKGEKEAIFQKHIPDVVEKTVKALDKPMIPLLGFNPGAVASWIKLFGKGKHSGLLEDFGRIVKEAEGTGKSPEEILEKVGFGDRGRTVNLPGLPAMTDYELHPLFGACPPPGAMLAPMLGMGHAVWDKRTTAYIIPLTREMEEEAALALSENLERPVHVVGLQYPEEIWNRQVVPEIERDESTDAGRTMAFLDKMKAKHGEKSVIYISFGSLFFPLARPSIVTALLSTLISTRTPFIFSHATDVMPPPNGIFDSVESYEDGLVIKTAPQLSVLNHPATNLFVSHCGANSTCEAIVAGVPILGLPFMADQGEFCHLLKKYGAAHDIKQAKTFYGPGPFPETLYDGTKYLGTDQALEEELLALWTKGKEDKYGDELRKEMSKVTRLCKDSRDSGSSYQEIKALEKYF